MYDDLMNFLSKYDLSIINCKSKSFDNASAMSGKYVGLQSKVLEDKNLVFRILCAHSLNLVGEAAVVWSIAAVKFYDFIEQLFVFYTVSTKLYELLVKAYYL